MLPFIQQAFCKFRLLIFMVLLPQLYCIANVHIAAVFSDHMVLQRDAEIHIWGTTDSPESITVSFAGKKIKTTAINNTWEVQFAALQAGGPFSLSIEGQSNTLLLNDILIGDLWICAGQSNMRLRVNQAYGAGIALLLASNNNLRLSDWEGKLEPINKKYTIIIYIPICYAIK